jgi:hypothetical protein
VVLAEDFDMFIIRTVCTRGSNSFWVKLWLHIGLGIEHRKVVTALGDGFPE